VEKKFEIEHTFIDFRMMIIGAKIKQAAEGKVDYKLNQTEIASMMVRDDDNM